MKYISGKKLLEIILSKSSNLWEKIVIMGYKRKIKNFCVRICMVFFFKIDLFKASEDKEFYKITRIPGIQKEGRLDFTDRVIGVFENETGQKSFKKFFLILIYSSFN